MPDDLTLYDPLSALPATMVLTTARIDALQAAFQANGRKPLTADEVTAAVGIAPAAVTSLPAIGNYDGPGRAPCYGGP